MNSVPDSWPPEIESTRIRAERSGLPGSICSPLRCHYVRVANVIAREEFAVSRSWRAGNRGSNTERLCRGEPEIFSGNRSTSTCRGCIPRDARKAGIRIYAARNQCIRFTGVRVVQMKRSRAICALPRVRSRNLATRQPRKRRLASGGLDSPSPVEQFCQAKPQPRWPQLQEISVVSAASSQDVLQ